MLSKVEREREPGCTRMVKRNKRPMGHISRLRKQFKSINTYDYIITMIKRRKKNIIILMRIKWFFFEQI